jgi:hypothetical protein
LKRNLCILPMMSPEHSGDWRVLSRSKKQIRERG